MSPNSDGTTDAGRRRALARHAADTPRADATDTDADDGEPDAFAVTFTGSGVVAFTDTATGSRVTLAAGPGGIRTAVTVTLPRDGTPVPATVNLPTTLAAPE